MLDAVGLNAWMNEHYRGEGAEAFRLETRQVYEVGTDGSDFQRWLAGEQEPTWERKQAWFEALDRERVEGRRRLHVRIVTRPITSYTGYECTWGYALNREHGQAVRVLDVGERNLPGGLPSPVRDDWWLVTDADGAHHVLLMRYNEHDQFLGAERPQTPLQEFVVVRDVLWEAAEDFESWYARHPELHRPPVAA